MLKETIAVVLMLSCVACGSEVGDSNQGTEGGGSEGGGSAGGAGEGGAGGAAASECETPPSVGSFELGSGETCFEPLVDGATVPLISGPQGGYHLWVAVGCSDCAAQVSLEWGVRDPATGETLANTYSSQGAVSLSGGAWPQAAGMIAGMPGVSWDPEVEPPLAPGTHVILWVETVGGVSHASEVEVVIGETVSWDPCAETPDDPNCQELG